MICACGKAESDGKRCKLGATHQPPPEQKHALVMPWDAKPEPPKEKMPWET